MVGTANKSRANGLSVQALPELVDHLSSDEGELVSSAFASLRDRAASSAVFGDTAIAAAVILRELHLDGQCIAAALLHASGLSAMRGEDAPDVPESVARLLDGLHKLEVADTYRTAQGAGPDDRLQVARLKELMFTLVDDVRVVVIKLAEALGKLRRTKTLSLSEARMVAAETLDVYAPVAGRLGIWQLKWELEDLAFRTLDVESYQRIARQLDERRDIRQDYIEDVVRQLEHKLAEHRLAAVVSGRPKHIYSIWRKMNNKQLDFAQLLDLRAVRILVDDVPSCYAALGIVHSLWPHVPREFDDYITKPKPNQYQSLHTAVIGPQGKTLEAQIRTHAMHAHAELGVAAHWRYKEGNPSPGDAGQHAKVAWFRHVFAAREVDLHRDDIDAHVQAELSNERVYAVTPKGMILDLPVGATPLDFAYQVHTEIGHRCRGAKVNGAIVPLTYKLTSGDQVDIITAREPSPSRDWLSPHLGYLRSPRARAKVRQWFNQLDYANNVAGGSALFDREVKRLGVSELQTSALLKRFNYTHFDDLLAALGRGDLSTARLATALGAPLSRKSPVRTRPQSPVKRTGASVVDVSGVGNLLSQFAKCCKPLPPEAIVGYITRGRGVTIHRAHCRAITRVTGSERARLIDVSWGAGKSDTYPVELAVVGLDRQGLLHDITAIFSNQKLNVTAFESKFDDAQQRVLISIGVEVTSLSQLSEVMDRIAQLSHVIEIRRKN